MSTVAIVVLTLLAIPTGGYIGLLAAWWLIERCERLRHRLKVRRAIRDGWSLPRLSSNWAVINEDDVVLKGVSGIEVTPDQGVTVTQYAKHASKVQRRLEQTWLDGIRHETRKQQAAPENPAHRPTSTEEK